MSWTWLGPLILVGASFVVIGLETLWPYDRDERHKLVRKGLWVDLVEYGIVQSYVLGFVINPLVHLIDDTTGMSQHGIVSAWPFWLQLGFFILLHDFYIYWFHRFQHKNKYLWRVHEAHHSAVSIDWIAGARSHPIEILINQTIEVGAMVLLGGGPELPILIKMLISASWGMWIHANVGVRSGWLQKIINGPEMHRWHHSMTFRAGGQNYATKFAFWDWMFGSAYLPAEKPPGYGISNPFPPGYFAQVAACFRRFDGSWPASPTIE
jgi:sterol desaturase/sphingolipid hydroxylase (fatty acid hydroxylase superfamily)